MESVNLVCDKQAAEIQTISGLSPAVIAAHELKSPLGLIHQMSLALGDVSLSKSERLNLINRITLTSERAIRLTSDLTKASRLQDAMFELEPINPFQLCEDVIAELKPFIESHGRKIKLTSKNRSLLTIANRDLLRRIILNFSDNAINYTDSNSLIEIKIGSVCAGSFIRLGVRDYGPALSKLVSRKIKSGKLHSPLPMHHRPNSSGLGLYIINQFAGAMDGKIGVVNHRDGVTFYVDLHASKQLSLL